MVLRKIGDNWALVSKKNPDKVLKWFGQYKPSKEQVLKEERRIQFFKRRNIIVKAHPRRGVRGKVKKHPRKRSR